MSVERTAQTLLEDTVSMQRDEWRKLIQEALAEGGTGEATVVTMETCPHTDRVISDVKE